MPISESITAGSVGSWQTRKGIFIPGPEQNAIAFAIRAEIFFKNVTADFESLEYTIDDETPVSMTRLLSIPRSYFGQPGGAISFDGAPFKWGHEVTEDQSRNEASGRASVKPDSQDGNPTCQEEGKGAVAEVKEDHAIEGPDNKTAGTREAAE